MGSITLRRGKRMVVADQDYFCLQQLFVELCRRYGALVRLKSVAKIARFTRSPGGVVFRIEKKNDVFSFERFQRDGASIISDESKVRRSITFGNHSDTPPIRFAMIAF